MLIWLWKIAHRAANKFLQHAGILGAVKIEAERQEKCFSPGGARDGLRPSYTPFLATATGCRKKNHRRANNFYAQVKSCMNYEMQMEQIFFATSASD